MYGFIVAILWQGIFICNGRQRSVEFVYVTMQCVYKLPERFLYDNRNSTALIVLGLLQCYQWNDSIIGLCVTQILSIDGVEVRDYKHENVIKLFQDKESLNLIVLPSRYRDVSCYHVYNRIRYTHTSQPTIVLKYSHINIQLVDMLN